MTPARRDQLRKLYRRVRRPALLGTLRRTTPLSRSFGYDRGQPIDRYYIEKFLAMHAAAITGHVLEIKDSGYTHAFGTNIVEAAVLDVDKENPQATIHADLTRADAIAKNSFDCILLTQTLQLIYDVPAAIWHAHRILKPGGTLLVTVPTLSRVVSVPGRFHDYWRFTEHSCRCLFEDPFSSEKVKIIPYGNVLSSIGFLLGMAREELSRRELEYVDADYAMLLGVLARKAHATPKR